MIGITAKEVMILGVIRAVTGLEGKFIFVSNKLGKEIQLILSSVKISRRIDLAALISKGIGARVTGGLGPARKLLWIIWVGV